MTFVANGITVLEFSFMHLAFLRICMIIVFRNLFYCRNAFNMRSVQHGRRLIMATLLSKLLQYQELNFFLLKF